MSNLPEKSVPSLLQPRRGETIVACPHAAAGAVNWFYYDPPMEVQRQYGKTVVQRTARFFAVCDVCLQLAGDPLTAATDILTATGNETIRSAPDPRESGFPEYGHGRPVEGDGRLPQKLRPLLDAPSEREC